MMKKLAVLSVVLFMITAVVGCDIKKKHFAPPPEPRASQIKIVEHSATEEWWEFGEEWITTVTGTARNDNDKMCDPIIMVRFYDYDDVMVGKSCDYLWDMPAGETWKFEIRYYGEKIKSYKIWVERV